ncbi:hypothetical protein GCM10010486_27760 [Nonomuraea roseoviolacea subsp. carminata]
MSGVEMGVIGLVSGVVGGSVWGCGCHRDVGGGAQRAAHGRVFEGGQGAIAVGSGVMGTPL